MDRKEKVLSYIKSREYVPLKKEELAAVLCVPEEDLGELERILGELCDEGKILKTKKKRYEPNNSKKRVEGTLSCSARGFYGFVDCDDGASVFVKGERMNGALDGDRVIAAIISADGEKPEGHIIKIKERANTEVCGVVKYKRRDYYSIHSDTQKLYAHVHVFPEDMLSAREGDRVIVEVTEYYPELVGKVKKILGGADEIMSKTESILYINGIDTEFSEKALTEAEEANESVTPADIEGRRDFRHLNAITIDGDDARDFDDAVSLEMCENGNYRLGVHIADVTHYVKEGGESDREAFERGTSVYLPGRVIPMLPERLSNGICSLNPREDRLTLSLVVEIDRKGNAISHELCEGVICSKERMTYSGTAKLLEEPTPELTAKYGYLLPMLRNMRSLAEILGKKRAGRGSIDFDFPESKIIVNDKGEPEDIILEKREISHKIIEEFMLCANETVAEYAFWAEIPFVYRIHEPPGFESMTELQKFISALGVGIKGKFSKTEPVRPKAVAEVLDKVKGTDIEHAVSLYTLRSMMKAEYKAENKGHFGLAAKYYCHFTSPIRRYPDLAIHRILKAFIKGKSLEKYSAFAEKAASRSSECEKKAQEVERETGDFLKAYYMLRYIGYIFDAKISSVTEFGVFAELENGIEGMVRVENMKDDYYIFNPENKTLIGRDTQKTYKIGDCVEVAVAACNPDLGKIDFIFAENADMSDVEEVQKREYRHMRKRRKKIESAAAKTHTKSHKRRKRR